MRGKVGERGQVTIPKALRERLGIEHGTELEFEADKGRLVARKVIPPNALDSLYGAFADGRRTHDVMREIRGDPEL